MLKAGWLIFCCSSFIFFIIIISSSFFFFNDRLKQRDLLDRSTYVVVATNFRRQIGEICEKAFLLGTRIPQGMTAWQSGWTR